LVGLFPRVGFEYPFHWSLSLTPSVTRTAAGGIAFPNSRAAQ
jgi:hypothetical protein